MSTEMLLAELSKLSDKKNKTDADKSRIYEIEQVLDARSCNG